jgi:hypothetical protein
MVRSRYRWLGPVGAGLPSLLPLLFILVFGVQFHFWDEWDPNWAGMYVKAFNGQLTFADLVAQHNEHRMVVPRLIQLAMNHFDHWNNFHVLIAGWIFVCITSILLLPLCRRSSEEHATTRWFLCNLLLFAPIQYQNWLWGAGGPYFLAPMFLVLILLILGSRASYAIKLLSTLLFATAATYSNGNGVLCWPIAAVLIAWPEPDGGGKLKTAQRIMLALISAGFVANVALYLINFHLPQFGGAQNFHAGPLQLCLYFLVFIGNPFAYYSVSNPIATGAVAGAVLLLALLESVGYFIFAWRNGSADLCRRMLPWLAIAAFAVGSAAMATRGRAGYGPDQALQSRYATSSLYLPIALVNLLPLICADLAKRRPDMAELFDFYIPASLCGAVIIAMFCCLDPAITRSRHWSDSLRNLKGALLMINILPDNPQLYSVYPTPDVLLRQANDANRVGYISPPLIESNDADQIRAADSAQAGGVVGKLESCAGDLASGDAKIVGWAGRSHPAKSADAVFLTYQDASGRSIICAMADLDIPRDDIVDQTGESGYQRCGWQVLLPPSRIPSDLKRTIITAWVLDTDNGKAYPLDGAFEFKMD